MLTVAITFIRINGTCSLFWMREKCTPLDTFAFFHLQAENCYKASNIFGYKATTFAACI